MKKSLIILVFVLIAFQGKALAQQKEPLAMRVMVDWTVAGAAGGIAVGIGIWLTDPGRPGNKLSEQLAGGAAWGAVAGAAYGIMVLNQKARRPIAAITEDPLHPANRIAADPIKNDEERQDLLAGISLMPGRTDAISLPVLDFRF